MKRLNILVFTLLARGHIFPVLPLCRELTQRGHRVACATTHDFAKEIERSGGEVLLFESTRLGDEYDKWWNGLEGLPFDAPAWWSPPDAWIRNLHKETATLHARVRQFYGSRPPDLVLYDQYYYPGNVVTRRLECPRVRISAHFANYKNFLMRQDGICLNPDSLVEFGRRVRQFMSDEGAQPGDGFWFPDELNIQLVPDDFQYRRSSFDDRFCFCGRSTERSVERRWVSRAADRPIVLISGFSGIFGVRYRPNPYVPMLVEALANSELHCVLLSEDADPKLESLPSNFELRRDVSPLDVLARASLLVCPGGMGSTLEATCSGVPVLSIPTHPQADEVAYRAAELGIARRMRREDISHRDIRNAIAEILRDSNMAEMVKTMQNAFRRCAGVAEAADRLERFVRERPEHHH